MEQSNTNKLSFINIFFGIIITPAKTWKKIVLNNTYKYMWLFFFIIVELSVVPYAFLTNLDFIFSFLLINSIVWIGLLIQWGMIYSGLAVTGVKTDFSFINNVRMYAYNSIVQLIVLPFAIIRVIKYPKTLSIVTKFPHYKPVPVIVYIHAAIIALYAIWFLVLLIISVKRVFKLSYKRSAFSVLFIPGIIGLVIGSGILLAKIF